MTDLRTALLPYLEEALRQISGPGGEWAAKGFIDLGRKIYPIPSDTKVLSKVLEVMLMPTIARFAHEAGLEVEWCAEQNFYPDVTLKTADGEKIALDLKSAYRRTEARVSGFTLGAFTGYFRNRTSRKNVMHPYGEYARHYVLGIVYTEVPEASRAPRVFSLDDLDGILSVIRDLEVILHEKFRIASDRPGSGNTKNIGSCTALEGLRAGSGPFADLGVEVFDDYWMYYLTGDMARQAELTRPPYRNLAQYLEYRGIGRR